MSNLDDQLRKLEIQALTISKAKRELLLKKKMVLKVRELYSDADIGWLPDGHAEAYRSKLVSSKTPGAHPIFFFDKEKKQYQRYHLVTLKLGSNEVEIGGDAEYVNQATVLEIANSHAANVIKIKAQVKNPITQEDAVFKALVLLGGSGTHVEIMSALKEFSFEISKTRLAGKLSTMKKLGKLFTTDSQSGKKIYSTKRTP